MMKVYNIQIETISPLAGGIPVVPDFLRGKIARDLKQSGSWTEVVVQLGNGDPDKAIKFLLDTNWKEVEKALELYPKEIHEQLTVFRRDENGNLIVRDYNIRAFIKETAINVLGYRRAEVKEKIKHGIAIEPTKIVIMKKEGDSLIPVDIRDVKLQEISGHVITNKGPRSIIKYFEVLLPPVYLEFNVLVAEDYKGRPILTEKELRKIFEEGGRVNGLLSNRSMGYGKFRVVKFEEVKND